MRSAVQIMSNKQGAKRSRTPKGRSVKGAHRSAQDGDSLMMDVPANPPVSMPAPSEGAAAMETDQPNEALRGLDAEKADDQQPPPAKKGRRTVSGASGSRGLGPDLHLVVSEDFAP